MIAVSVFAAIGKQKGGQAPYPLRELALVIALVVLAAGYFLPLHLLGALNLLVASPRITPAVVITALLIGIGASVLWLSRRATIQRPELTASTEPRLSRGLIVILALTALPYAAFILDSLWSFPTGYDPIAYHINVALKFLQHGSMYMNPAWRWWFSLPSNAEMPALAALSANMPGAIAMGNMLAAVLLGLSVYLIAWRLTGESQSAILSAVIAVTIPIVICQAVRLYVDLFGTAFLIAAVALLIWRAVAPEMCVALAGYAAGLAIGSKPVFWVYGAIFTVAALAVIFIEKKLRLRLALLLIGGIVLSSGLWFLRSELATGNPVFPLRVAVGNFVIFPGHSRAEITAVGYGIASVRDALIQPWSEALTPSEHGAGLPIGGDRGTGPLFAAIALPGVLFVLLRVIRRGATLLERSLLAGTAVCLALWITTLLRVPRFALIILALCCALAAPMLHALLADARRVIVSLFVIGVSLNALYCLAEPAQRALYRMRRHDFSRSTYYGYPPIIDQLPPGSRIVDLTEGYRSSFLLAGANLRNYVLPTGVNPRSGDYVVKDGAPDREDAVLRSEGTTLLYNATPPSLYPKTARPWRIYRVR